MSTQKRFFDRLGRDLPAGQLTWIGLRTERKGKIEVVEEVEAVETLGLSGDRRCLGTPGSSRQVTIISHEFIKQIQHYMGIDHPIDPALLRRNLVVTGINLNALRHQTFQIGSAIFEATAQCHPCSRMDKALGPGAVAAMLGHGGLCAKVVRSGQLKIGDDVTKLPANLSLI